MNGCTHWFLFLGEPNSESKFNDGESSGDAGLYMGVELRPEKRANHKIVVVHASGKLMKEDHELFLPKWSG